jgi:arabinose-5-phosphate isomerase
MPAFKSLEIPIIGFVGSRKSTLAGQCDVVLSTHVPNEACPLGIVPTASAIVMSALGDALAIALLDKRGFEKKDFAGLHPGGALGKKLLTTVADLMHTGQEIPLASVNKPMREVLFEMTEKGFGIVGIINAENQLIGVITDGDLRRGLEKTDHFLNSLPDQLMSVNPKWISADSLAIDALHEMETYAITALFVFKDTKTGKPLGIIHIHDILRHGIMSV